MSRSAILFVGAAGIGLETVRGGDSFAFGVAAVRAAAIASSRVLPVSALTRISVLAGGNVNEEPIASTTTLSGSIDLTG